MGGRETKRDIVLMTNTLFSNRIVPSYMINSHNCCEYRKNTYSHIYVILPEAASVVEGSDEANCITATIMAGEVDVGGAQV